MTRWRWLLAGLLLPSLLGAAPAPEVRFPLDAGLTAALLADGGLAVLAAPDSGAGAPAVVLGLDARPAAADSLSPRILTAGAGDPGGRRGLLGPADDDGDGLVNEDPLDGRDDDGDGRVDEDGAVVGDVMAVAAFPGGARLTLSHWSHPHLAGVVLLRVFPPAASAGAAAARCRLTGHGNWRTLDLPGRTRAWLPVAGNDGPAPDVRVARVTTDDRDCWLGLLVLDGRWTEREAAGNPCLAGDPELAVVVAAARSPVRLAGLLMEARSVAHGAPLTRGGPLVPWLVTPPPDGDAAAAGLAAGWRPDAGGWELVLTVAGDACRLPDPDGFRRDDAPCGPPVEVALLRPGGRGSHLPASPRNGPAVADAADATAYLRWQSLLVPGATLSYRFAGEPPRGEVVDLSGTWPFGGRFRLAARRLAAADSAGGHRPPSLSPALLEGYPNPFRDRLMLRFKVPETVGEGFVWDAGEPPLLDPADPIPYSNPLPRVTLKIYAISGREVATLYDQPTAPGEYRADWNGRDLSGHPVAQGTYFCKLQVDKWSVTKRISVIR